MSPVGARNCFSIVFFSLAIWTLEAFQVGVDPWYGKKLNHITREAVLPHQTDLDRYPCRHRWIWNRRYNASDLNSIKEDYKSSSMRCVRFSYSLVKPCDERAFRLAGSYANFPLFNASVKKTLFFVCKKNLLHNSKLSLKGELGTSVFDFFSFWGALNLCWLVKI